VNVWTGGAVPHSVRNVLNKQYTTAENISERPTPNHSHEQSHGGVTWLTPPSAPTALQHAVAAEEPGATGAPEAMSQTPNRRIPEQEYPSSQYDWTCVHSALHLVGLRSPTRRSYAKARSRYFQFVSSLVVPPTRIPQKLGLSTLEFDLSKEEIAKVSKTSSESLDDHPTAHYFNHSRRYRLRLSKSLTQDDTIKESDWMVLPSHWPEEIYISFNNKPKMLRRKQHFHTDLPMELSDVVVEGKNVVMISLPPCKDARSQTQKHRYFMAVEMIATVKEEDIVSMIEGMAQIPAQETWEEIDRRLSPPDSDDVVAADNSLNISLTDPFSFQTVNVPVRGVDCKHLDCFDLRTWLETRPRKPTKHGRKEPSLIDVWKCPICDRDARPNNLRIDGFLTSVLAELVVKGKGSTKRIRVIPGGAWEPIMEPDDSSDEDLGPAKPSQAGPRTTVPIMPAEVVVLDD
jgi:hypothetical protein